jgi:hypothetical protein
MANFIDDCLGFSSKKQIQPKAQQGPLLVVIFFITINSQFYLS